LGVAPRIMAVPPEVSTAAISVLQTTDPADRLAGTRDLLELFGVASSEWRFLQDGQPLQSGEREILHRVLFLLPRIDRLERIRWARPQVDWEALQAESESSRGELFSLAGRAISVAVEELPPELAKRFLFREYYRVLLRPSKDNLVLEVYTREIPVAWKFPSTADEPTASRVRRAPVEGWPVRCDAIFLKSASGDGGVAPDSLMFATDHLAWHPAAATPGPPAVSEGQAILGRHGMDVNLLANLAHRRPLEKLDRESFYQMLWTARRIAVGEPLATTRSLRIPEALLRPQSLTGDSVHVTGLARRAIRVQVPDADVQARFGIRHYFEIELFVDLPQTLILQDPTDGRELVYDRFPITICTPELPDGMPQGDDIRQPIAAQAFFWKLWSYRSLYTSDATGQGRAGRQQSPLLIAPRVELVDSDPPANPWPVIGLGTILFGGFAAVLVVRFWYARSDRPFRQWQQRRLLESQSRLGDVDVKNPPAGLGRPSERNRGAASDELTRDSG
jgi:hypothetical protein